MGVAKTLDSGSRKIESRRFIPKFPMKRPLLSCGACGGTVEERGVDVEDITTMRDGGQWRGRLETRGGKEGNHTPVFSIAHRPAVVQGAQRRWKCNACALVVANSQVLLAWVQHGELYCLRCCCFSIPARVI